MIVVWTLAEAAGDATPDGMQRLLNSAAWSTASCTCRSRRPMTGTAAARPRCPDDAQFATKPELARAMLGRALDAGLPAAWVTADEAYGRDLSPAGPALA